MPYKYKPLPVSLFKEYLYYEEGTGRLFWTKKPSAKVYVNDEAGVVDLSGYRSIWLKGNKYLAHRAAWAYHFGKEPSMLDHINGDKDDNRIINLRETDHSLNQRDKPVNNNTGIRGVYQTSYGTYSVHISVTGSAKYFGTFKTLEEASAIADGIITENFYDVYRR